MAQLIFVRIRFATFLTSRFMVFTSVGVFMPGVYLFRIKQYLRQNGDESNVNKTGFRSRVVVYRNHSSRTRESPCLIL